MENLFDPYYHNQVGTGIAGFSGHRFQTGNGFLDSLKSFFKIPAVRYLLRKSVKTGVNIGTDILNGGDIANSVKHNLENTGKSIARDTINMANQYLDQKGGGVKRKRLYKRRKCKRRKVSRKTKKPKICKKRKPKKYKRAKKKKKSIDLF